MPELPDVQVFREYLDATSLHRGIEHVYVSADRVLSDVSASTLRRRMKGSRLASTRRHGKHLFTEIDSGGWLRLHFGMTGRLASYEDGEEASMPDHTRLRLDFEDGSHLAFVNRRRLGQIGFVSDPGAYVEDQGLGPDALSPEFDADALAAVLEGRRGALKATLMNQAYIAGIGNVYADEMLFQAGLHPESRAGALDRDRTEALHRAMRRVLEDAIEARVEDFPDHFLLPHRGPEGRCPKCGQTLERLDVSGRTTYLCPRDQSRTG